MENGFALLGLALTAAAVPHQVVRNRPGLDFRYEWPAEAAAIPALDMRLSDDAKRQLADAQDGAAEDKKQYVQEGRGTVRDLSLTKWAASGESARLLSLRSDYEVYTGGAHPNYNVSSLLWDRQLNRQIEFGGLFNVADSYAPILQSAYCHKLYDSRTKRNGERTGEVFEMCPKFSDLAIIPTDHDRNGRFDEILVVASPYTAGSFAEGEYDIALPVTPQLVAAMKPEYRSSFETQRH
jgi:hypothetical protein